MELLEVKHKQALSREEAAKLLHQIADAMAKQNSLHFSRDGLKCAVNIADQVDMEIELEVEDDGSSLEIEIKW